MSLDNYEASSQDKMLGAKQDSWLDDSAHVGLNIQFKMGGLFGKRVFLRPNPEFSKLVGLFLYQCLLLAPEAK